jgi:lipid-binding SYLF domain-containing protein
MSQTSIGRRTASLAATVVAGALLAFAPAALAANGTIELEIYKAGFIVGGSGGSGTLKFGGKSYPLTIGGVSLGATIGFSKAQLVGTVRNIKNPSDIEGTFTAGTAGVAVAGGPKVAELKNSKGVELSVKGQQIGLEFSVDLSGMEIKLKKK